MGPESFEHNQVQGVICSKWVIAHTMDRLVGMKFQDVMAEAADEIHEARWWIFDRGKTIFPDLVAKLPAESSEGSENGRRCH
jgi:hypothetical protein